MNEDRQLLGPTSKALLDQYHADHRRPSSDTVEPLVGRWCVHVIVCGIYTGAYKFETEEQAQADAADRRQKFGVLGCRYIVAPNKALSEKEPNQ